MTPTMSLLNSQTSSGVASIPTPQMSQMPGYRREGMNRKGEVNAELEHQIVAWASQQYRDMKSNRSRLEMQWYINLAFYFGRQYVEPMLRAGQTTSGGRLTIPTCPPWRVRMVINRVRGAIRKEMAKLTSQKPSVTVVPSSSDDRDYFAAQAGEQIWDSTYREKKIKAHIRRSVWWSLITGNGFLKTWWDDNEIDDFNNLRGSLCYSTVTPFHILVPDLREEELENQPYLIHVQTRPKDWVTLNYPDLGDVTPDTAEANDILEDSFMGITGQKELIDRKKAVVIKECWIKPNCIPQFPTGGMLTVVGNRLAQICDMWPYEHSKYPFSKIDHIPTGKFYSDSSIIDLLPLQREYNRTRSQIIESKNLMSKPQWTAQRGSIDPAKVTSAPGQWLLYQPGFERPQPVAPPPLPSYVLQEIERLIHDWDDISGQHEVSKGQAPPGVTAATAISYLQEQDESMLAHTFDSLEEAVEKTAFMTLSLIKQYWVVERIVKIVGTDGSFDAQAFKGSDLRNNTDIRVEGGSSLPTSKAAKQAFIMDLMKMGFIPPQQGLEVMDIGGLNKITDQIKIDIRQAQRENLKMASVTPDQLMQYNQIQMEQAAPNPMTGMPTNPEYQLPQQAQDLMQMQQDPVQGQLQQPVQAIDPPIMVPTHTWDNHQVHIAKHNDFRKSQAFDNLPEETKQLFEAHVQDHTKALQFEMMQQQMLMGNSGIGNENPDSTGQLESPSASSGETPPGLPM